MQQVAMVSTICQLRCFKPSIVMPAVSMCCGPVAIRPCVQPQQQPPQVGLLVIQRGAGHTSTFDQKGRSIAIRVASASVKMVMERPLQNHKVRCCCCSILAQHVTWKTGCRQQHSNSSVVRRTLCWCAVCAECDSCGGHLPPGDQAGISAKTIKLPLLLW